MRTFRNFLAGAVIATLASDVPGLLGRDEFGYAAILLLLTTVTGGYFGALLLPTIFKMAGEEEVHHHDDEPGGQKSGDREQNVRDLEYLSSVPSPKPSAPIAYHCSRRRRPRCRKIPDYYVNKAGQLYKPRRTQRP